MITAFVSSASRRIVPYGTRSPRALSLLNPVSSAGQRPVIGTTCALPSLEPWGGKVSDEWMVPSAPPTTAPPHRGRRGKMVEGAQDQSDRSCQVAMGGETGRDHPGAEQSKGADKSRTELILCNNESLLRTRHEFRGYCRIGLGRLTQGRWPDSFVTDTRARGTTWRSPTATTDDGRLRRQAREM